MGRPRVSRQVMAFLFMLVFCASATFGQEFWEKKDYSQWTQDEIRKLISNSPWAKDVTINAAAVTGPARGAPVTDVEDTGGAGAGRGRGGRGRGGAGAGGGGEVLLTLNISWRSALPLKKALLKSRQLANVPVPPELQEGLTREESNYIVVLSGIPLPMARAFQNPDQLKQSVLKRGRKQPIALAGVEFQPRTQSVDFIFVFPKADRITEDDKEIEVVLKLGQIEAKRKFNLKEMAYNGKLEL